MLYAILCYNSEEVLGAWTQAEDDAVMARLDVVHQRLERRASSAPPRGWPSPPPPPR
jgi:hypothetical protein